MQAALLRSPGQPRGRTFRGLRRLSARLTAVSVPARVGAELRRTAALLANLAQRGGKRVLRRVLAAAELDPPWVIRFTQGNRDPIARPGAERGERGGDVADRRGFLDRSSAAIRGRRPAAQSAHGVDPQRHRSSVDRGISL